MSKHMAGQSFATVRNSQVEFFVQYILIKFVSHLVASGDFSSPQVKSQVLFKSIIASDIWDHYLELKTANNKKIQLWCQTTCYKGNKTGKPESNKTYEVRETLTEAISIRGSFVEPEIEYFTIHFTVGDKKYVYKWFSDLKDASFDKSIYVFSTEEDVFQLIAEGFAGLPTDQQREDYLEKSYLAGDSLGLLIADAVDQLIRWWNTEQSRHQELAKMQWDLVRKQLLNMECSDSKYLDVKGVGIKDSVNEMVFGKDLVKSDPLIRQTAAKLLKKNPFLSSVIEILNDWELFDEGIRAVAEQSKDSSNFLSRLWKSALPKRLSIRRILLRLHTDEGINYIADRDIHGITEHNLYNGDHESSQSNQLVDQILADLNSEGISTISEIYHLIAKRGKSLLNSARWFEAKNGTQLKPSFDYVCLALAEHRFSVFKPSDCRIRLSGYHATLSSENVRPYTNFKVVTNSSGDKLCLLKAKYFRQQEFPRRCKEEAFVALTLKYSFRNPVFRSSGRHPLVMFVDMSSDCNAPTYAINRLKAFGWHVVFSVPELVDLLRHFEKARK